MTLSRRAWLARQAWLLALPLGACATGQGAESDRIVDTATGQSLTPDEVALRIRNADVALLGELHDNPHHHARRAALLAAIGLPVPVVVEHLPQGAAPRLANDASGDALRQALEAAGFDSRSWRWPLHEPLFSAVARGGHPLRGGNLARDSARRIAREGVAALPPELKAIVDAAPLSDPARQALEQDLQGSHCGHMDAARVPGMLAAQRGRDAAMALTLAAELKGLRARQGSGPVVLLAGNGHVRRDYGVPQLLASQQPGARLLTVGFAEREPDAPSPDRRYDIVWATPPAAREDPCKAFGASRPASG